MDLSAFVQRKRIGLVLRTFATKEADVKARVQMVEEVVAKALGVTVEGHGVIRRIDVLVWADPRYKDADCGKTTAALRDTFRCEPATQREVNAVRIHEVAHGDLFCGLLNYGIGLQLRDRVDYSLVVSPDARSYLTPESLRKMCEAAANGARAVGLAISELEQSILDGRLANTFAMWDTVSLVSVGGFDLRAVKPVDERLAHYMRGWSPEAGEVYYHLAGVEEVIPLARLAATYGPCIAPILPQGEGVQRYQVPDPAASPELWKRHVSKMGTKLERQAALLASVGFDPSYLNGGIMPAYRR